MIHTSKINEILSQKGVAVWTIPPDATVFEAIQMMADKNVGAESAEVEQALLGDDTADQKRNEQNDRHRAPGDVVELMHQRG